MEIRKGYDDIVVGTGPGGATVARALAAAGRSVLLVEYGPRFTKTGFLQTASRVFLDEDRKATVSDGEVWFGRPRILGGASYVAMGNAATPPRRILDDWGVDLLEELEWARRELRVTPMPEEFMGPATLRLNAAAEGLGWSVRPTPKCVDFSKCRRCSLCMFGCPTGAKWTTLEFIAEALSSGADLLLETKVTRVLHAKGRVEGIAAIRKGQEIRCRGRNVILAAGGLGTPVILRNSDLDAGKGLAGDVFQGTYGDTGEVGMKGEIILATYLEDLIEARELFPAPYMYIPALMVRDSGREFPRRMGLAQQAKVLLRSRAIDTRRLSGMMTKIRDERTGEVHRDGTVSKRLTERDLSKLQEAYEINRSILIAAGARPESIFRGVYESGHPCCTAAMGEVVDGNQETEVSNLFVSDASVFPTPLGMPPILTIVALSRRLSRYLLSRE